MASLDTSEQTVSFLVESVLPEGEPQGTFVIPVTSLMTGQDLLRKLCHDANVPLKEEYILQSDTVVISPDTLLSSLNIQDGKSLKWGMTDDPYIAGRQCWNSYWFMAVLSLVIGAVGMVAIIYIHLRGFNNDQYGVVFDAGSSHTSMFVYKWDADKIDSTAVAAQYGTKCNTDGGGISSFASNTSEAGQTLVKCLEIAKSMIPEDKYKDTPIYLGATAGMRLLEKEDKNVSDAVLEAVRRTVAIYPFTFSQPEKQARILTGKEEGSFSWITSNYVTGAFHQHPPSDGTPQELIVSSVGALDLGGASTQISFVPNNTASVPEDFNFNMRLYGTNYSLYTYSYLCYGINEATTRYQAMLIKKTNFSTVMNNPCSPKGSTVNMSSTQIFSSACVRGKDAVQIFGYSIESPQQLTEDTNYTFIGQGNATACEALLADALFNFTENCTYPDNSCSFNGIYQPPVFGDFFAFSTFFYLMEFLNFTTEFIKHADFTAAYQTLCNKSWDEVKTMKTAVPENLPWYCFQSLYINTLLVTGYRFDPNSTWNSIHFVESISGTDAGWTLGFIINESNLLPSEQSTNDLTPVTFALLAVLFCAFLLLSVYFAYNASRYHRGIRRKFQGKSYGAI